MINAHALKLIFASSRVKRFHAMSTIGIQNNAEHQWGVALLVQYIHPQASKHLLLAALIHDRHEVATGDIPNSIKSTSLELKNILTKIEEDLDKTDFKFEIHLSEEEERLLKFADIMEAFYFACEQKRLGNNNLLSVREYCLEWMTRHMVNLDAGAIFRVNRFIEEFCYD